MVVVKAIATFQLMVLSLPPHDFAFPASLPKRTSVFGRVGVIVAVWLVAGLQFLPPALPPVSVAKSDSLSAAVSTLENVSVERPMAVGSERGVASLAQAFKDAREWSGALDSSVPDRCSQAARLLFACALESRAWASVGEGDSLVNLHVRLQI